MEYSFIVNPNSGSSRKKKVVRYILQNYPANKVDVIQTEYPGHAAKITRQLLDKNRRKIIAVGGDGTVNEIASQLVGTQAQFGIIPMGSGNGFARSLNIPMHPQQALNTIFGGYTIAVDVGRANDKFFFAVAGLGFDARIAFRFQESKRRGPLPYFAAGLKEFFKYPYHEFYVTNNHDRTTYRPLIITVANASQFGNGAKIAPQADLRDGLLDICVIQKMHFFQSLKAVSKMFAGNINSVPAYTAFTSDYIEISTQNQQIMFHLDGEPQKAENKVVFRVLPKSLNVITG